MCDHPKAGTEWLFAVSVKHVIILDVYSHPCPLFQVGIGCVLHVIPSIESGKSSVILIRL